MSKTDLVITNVIGKFLEKPSEMHGEWRISDFFSLPNEADTYYFSPYFHFLDAAWSLKICPHGNTSNKSEGWIGLYLCRIDCGTPKTVRYTLGMKKTDGKEEILVKDDRRTFLKKGWGLGKGLGRSDLLNRKSELAPSDVLTATCTLKSDTQHSSEVSLLRRLWRMGANLKDILSTKKRTDVVLKVKDNEIPAHRMILQSRSAVFDRMFSVDMRETKTGEVNVEDVDPDALKVALFYVYSGDPEGLSPENVCEVYKVAHKYEFQELKELCTEFMQECLSVDSVFDILVIADLYSEKELKVSAKAYLTRNKSEIFKTERWKIFKTENPAIVIDVLECILGDKD